jgi:hypothetical protein
VASYLRRRRHTRKFRILHLSSRIARKDAWTTRRPCGRVNVLETSLLLIRRRRKMAIHSPMRTCVRFAVAGLSVCAFAAFYLPACLPACLPLGGPSKLAPVSLAAKRTESSNPTRSSERTESACFDSLGTTTQPSCLVLTADGSPTDRTVYLKRAGRSSDETLLQARRLFFGTRVARGGGLPWHPCYRTGEGMTPIWRPAFCRIAQMPDVNVRYQGQPGKHLLALSFSQFGPIPEVAPPDERSLSRRKMAKPQSFDFENCLTYHCNLEGQGPHSRR